MKLNDRRQGGRPWLAVFVVSALLLFVATWQLGQGYPSFLAGGQPTAVAVASPPPTTASSTASPTASASTIRPEPRESSPSWPTRQATPGRADADQPQRPRLLRIPELKLTMPIIATTVDKTGQMALPEKPAEIGWYAYGPRPGAPEGSAVLAGHVDSREYGIGPLAKVRRLSAGDKIIVESAGDRSTFRVDSVRLISKRAVPLAEVFDRDGPARLRIVTCGGAYIPARGGYQDNVVVTATEQ